MVAVSCQSDCCVTNIMNLKKTNSLCRSYSSFCRLSVSLCSVVPDHYLKHFCLFVFFFFFVPSDLICFFSLFPPMRKQIGAQKRWDLAIALSVFAIDDASAAMSSGGEG